MLRQQEPACGWNMALQPDEHLQTSPKRAFWRMIPESHLCKALLTSLSQGSA